MPLSEIVRQNAEDNRTAAAYGVYQPGSDRKDEIKLHSTFIIHVDRTVLWCNTGHSPFLDNQTLQSVMARQLGLLAPQKKRQGIDAESLRILRAGSLL